MTGLQASAVLGIMAFAVALIGGVTLGIHGEYWTDGFKKIYVRVWLTAIAVLGAPILFRLYTTALLS